MVSSVFASSLANSAKPVEPSQQKSKLDYDSFLKLLVAQMKNQDPTKPMESTEYVAQLATFSNVEQSIQANKKLDQIIQESKVSNAAGLLGRTVTSLDGLGSGIVESVRFSQGELVATLAGGNDLTINDRVKISK